jgi:DNA helicase II / ATP-dependent DNA helicase PcrA
VEQKRNAAGTAPAIDALLEGLNPAQRSAVAFGIGAEGGPVPPLLIAAGAGTGKTKTLAHRVARLILEGADPRRLLLLTFTRRAALEMTRRAQQIQEPAGAWWAAWGLWGFNGLATSARAALAGAFDGGSTIGVEKYSPLLPSSR